MAKDWLFQVSVATCALAIGGGSFSLGCASVGNNVPRDARGSSADAGAPDSAQPDAAVSADDAFVAAMPDATSPDAFVGNDAGSVVCGDGLVDTSESCDDGNVAPGDGCSPTCTREAGFQCSDATPSVCMPQCGDGMRVGSEACDDGNTAANDGCSSSCVVETGFMCPMPTMSMTPPCAPICGDMRVIPPRETCDDGNTTDGDGCDSNCTNTACGNGVRFGAERCDDGNRTSGDGCHADCLSETEIEPNDDGSVRPGTSNTPNDLGMAAITAAVNNGVIRDSFVMRGNLMTSGDEDLFAFTNPAAEPRWVTFTVQSGTCMSDANDTVLVVLDTSGMQVAVNDDRVTGNRCPLVRVLVPAMQTFYVAVLGYNDAQVVAMYDLEVSYCGDGNRTGGETCDDGNTVNADGCDANCTVTGCGNGIVTGTEECDDGNVANGDGCDSMCRRPACGNGIRGGGETCDDGNVLSGDGCSSTCATELGFTCTGLVCRSAYEYYCSGGNDDDGDGRVDCADADCDCTLPLTCAGNELLVTHREWTDLPANINDGSGIARSGNFPAGTVSRAAVRLLIEHPYNADLVVSLNAPGRVSPVTLINRRGGSGNNFSNTTLADSCTASIRTGVAPFSGCYYPENPLSGLNGRRNAGIWTLSVDDVSTGDAGIWRGFTIGACVLVD